MRDAKCFLAFFLCMMSVTLAWAQPRGGTIDIPKDEFIPGAIYEIRYWTDMTSVDGDVLIDTLTFFGNDRAVFEYSSSNCVSYHCRDVDSMAYVLLPKLGGSDKTYIMGKNFVRRLNRSMVPFRGYDRMIYRLFITDLDKKNDPYGDYVLISKKFGIIYRYNSDGEQYMLNRIEVMKDGRTMDEIDMLPMQMQLQTTDIFTNIE